MHKQCVNFKTDIPAYYELRDMGPNFTIEKSKGHGSTRSL